MRFSEGKTVVSKPEENLIFAYNDGELPVTVYDFDGNKIDMIERNCQGTPREIIDGYSEETLKNMKTVLDDYYKVILEFERLFENELGHTHEKGLLNNWFFKQFPANISDMKDHYIDLRESYHDYKGKFGIKKSEE
jgi:hypothetical protein